ncbi:MAG: CHAT domain-containing protein [Aulosira sp. DedQUE10]|nr:CHAT domain-containing protein [Aulosira sp. DedQUE10]
MQYSLGEERSYLWAVTTSSMQAYTLPRRQEIEKIATRLHQSLQQPTASDLSIASAKKLNQIILAPVADQLLRKRLVIVADGALQTIPFAALADIIPQAKSGAGGQGKYQPLVLNAVAS